MTIETLKKKTRELGIPDGWYSINGHLAPDKHFLMDVYGKWEYFYFDERGNQRGYTQFKSEREACEFLLEKLKIDYYVN